MIHLLAKWFIPNYTEANDSKVRRSYGVLCSLVGITLNVLLAAGKFIAGVLSNSISITADATNNFSDAVSSVITLAGFKLSSQKPDPDHPFGHGRYEYISGLIVSVVIFVVALELLRNSIYKIFHPEELFF
ncbi:MAG: cation diffusion facilitator family transporter, partial [Acetatifactor sp.]|nr:cation diffusion facilitator family transporter [Acetatifactor sp.]